MLIIQVDENTIRVPGEGEDEHYFPFEAQVKEFLFKNYLSDKEITVTVIHKGITTTTVCKISDIWEQ